jgi:hypothetical protein
MKINVKSISFKLILGGVAAVVFPLLLVGYLSYTKAETALFEITKEHIKGIAEDLAKLHKNGSSNLPSSSNKMDWRPPGLATMTSLTH